MKHELNRATGERKKINSSKDKMDRLVSLVGGAVNSVWQMLVEEYEGVKNDLAAIRRRNRNIAQVQGRINHYQQQHRRNRRRSDNYERPWLAGLKSVSSSSASGVLLNNCENNFGAAVESSPKLVLVKHGDSSDKNRLLSRTLAKRDGGRITKHQKQTHRYLDIPNNSLFLQSSTSISDETLPQSPQLLSPNVNAVNSPSLIDFVDSKEVLDEAVEEQSEENNLLLLEINQVRNQLKPVQVPRSPGGTTILPVSEWTDTDKRQLSQSYDDEILIPSGSKLKRKFSDCHNEPEDASEEEEAEEEVVTKQIRFDGGEVEVAEDEEVNEGDLDVEVAEDEEVNEREEEDYSLVGENALLLDESAAITSADSVKLNNESQETPECEVQNGSIDC